MRTRLSLPVLMLMAMAATPADKQPPPASPDPRAILLVWEQAPELQYVREINEGFRDGLARAPTSPTLFIEYLDDLRFGNRPTHRTEFLDWLGKKYLDRHIDLIAVTAQDTLLLVAGRPSDLWPGVPLVYGTLGHLTVDVAAMTPPVSGLVLENYFPAYLAMIRQVLPDTRRIALVLGASRVERERADWWSAQIREQGFEVVDLVGLPLDTLLTRVASLPTQTVLFHLGMQTDATGRVLVANDVTKMIAAAANRAMFTLDDKDVGAGTVGGIIADWRITGHEYSRHILARLDGTSPRTEVLPAAQYTSFAFDARQLQRWHIPESRLPANSAVKFRQPSLWRDYRGTVIAMLAVGGFQTLLIIVILLERRSRARAKAALSTSYAQLRGLTKKLITAQEQERTRIARDLHDDIGQRIASFSIALSRLRRSIPDASNPVREELTTLQRQASTLSTDLRHLSHDLHPGALEHLGLLEALRARCDDFTSETGVPAQLSVSDDWREVPQMIQLCMYRVAQEALRNVAQHAKARQVGVVLRRQDADRVVMQVCDDGCGFEEPAAAQRSGLGLVSLGERVRMLGGDFDLRSSPAAGTTLTVTLPEGNSHAA